MSKQSEAIAANFKRLRDRYGEDVLFNGNTYRCRTSMTSGANAGQQSVSRETFGIFIASSAPRVFDFSPEDFAPTTEVPPPQEGNELQRNGLIYVITAVDYVNIDTDTVAIYCETLRKIWLTSP